ncbi:MAG TPA: hypothetical protein VHX65_20685 [Pirellulales bacterium]|jgi:hypothetical protein|nr:hypothetical protein [Pirellulales bacterium]
MSIAVTCPSGHALKIADSMAGRAGRCPFCRQIVHVPPLNRPAEVVELLAAKSRLGKRTAGAVAGSAGPSAAIAPPGAGSANRPATVAPANAAPPSAADPAAADTVLMPISISESPPAQHPPDTSPQPTAEPESPVAAEPDLMAQTLPLPTAELISKQAAPAVDVNHDINFDTVGHKAKIIGSWKVLGDTPPPYFPEPPAGSESDVVVGEFEEPALAPRQPADQEPPPSAASPLRLSPPRTETVATIRPGRRKTPSIVGRSAVGATSSWPPARVRTGATWAVRPTVYRIAAAMALVTLLSMWPALHSPKYWDLGIAPGWARGVLLIAILQLAYVAWLVSIPDWASLWGTMFVMAIVATLYGTAAAMTLATPMERDPPLGLQPIRGVAPAWCFSIMLLTISVAYACGHAAQRIRGDGRRATGE